MLEQTASTCVQEHDHLSGVDTVGSDGTCRRTVTFTALTRDNARLLRQTDVKSHVICAT
jgi:hypothetical protein